MRSKKYLIHYGVPHGKGPTGRGSGRYPFGFRKNKEKDWGTKLKDQNGEKVLKKGSVVKRISTTVKDTTRDDKKYVSINEKDNSKWEKYLGERYSKPAGVPTYIQTYKVKRDLKVMTAEQQGEKYIELLKNNDAFRNTSVNEFGYINYLGGHKIKDNPNNLTNQDQREVISRHIALQSRTGKAFINEVLKENKYGALVDVYGKDMAQDSLIILNARKNLKRSKKDLDLTKTTKDIIKKYHGDDWENEMKRTLSGKDEKEPFPTPKRLAKKAKIALRNKKEARRNQKRYERESNK